MLNLEAIKARLARATPGPWHVNDDTLSSIFVEDETERGAAKNGRWICGEFDNNEEHDENIANARLVAHAPADLDALIAEVERLRALVNEA